MSNESSNIVVINSDQYEVEIYLLKDPCASFGVIPIPYSNLKYLEITNDLANLGYYGKVTFINFNDILDELGVLKASENIPLLYFRLKSLAFPNQKSTYDDIYFIAALTQGQDVKENEIEGNSSYNFEELYVFKLKTTKLLREDNKFLNYNSKGDTVNDLLKKLLTFNSVTGDIYRTAITPFEGIFDKLGIFKTASAVKVGGESIDPNVSDEIVETGTPAEDTITLNTVIDIKVSTLLHDAIKQVTSYLSYKPDNISNGSSVSKDWYDPGLIKLENDINNKGQRKFVMFPLLGTINKFFARISGEQENQEVDPTKKYFNNFLTEKFSISQKNTAPTFSNNTITKYELKRVDISDVLEHKWKGVQCTSSVNCSNTDIIEYSELRSAFEQLCTSPYSSNLPVSNDTVTQYTKSAVPFNLAKAYGTNSVFKSFVFDNVMATFRVKGQPYRKPNRFISINPPPKDTKLDPVKSKDRTEIDGYWYVLSVNHVFIDGNYFNDFECVKIYKLGELPQQPPTPTIQTPSPVIQTPSVNSTNSPGSGTVNPPLDGPPPNIRLTPEEAKPLNKSPEEQRKTLQDFLKSEGVNIPVKEQETPLQDFLRSEGVNI
jgi:hypothetical protein